VIQLQFKGIIAMMGLMSSVMNSLQQIKRVEVENKEYLENLAVNLVKKELVFLKDNYNLMLN
jgi:hypothetical protein